MIEDTHLRKEELDDTKGVIRFRTTMKDIQHNEQQKTYKRTNNDLQNTTQTAIDILMNFTKQLKINLILKIYNYMI
jgi:hypothetical protein